MNDLSIWISIGTLVCMVIGLVISHRTLKSDIKQRDNTLKQLSEYVEIDRERVSIYQREVESIAKAINSAVALEKEKIESIYSLGREKLDLERREAESREKWKRLEAAGAVIKFLSG